MSDYKFEQNGDNYSDAYLADQKTSEMYAEAARAANEQVNPDNSVGQGFRKVSFNQNDDSNYDDVLEREKSFRESLDRVSGPVDKSNYDTNTYDLEDLDQDENSSQSTITRVSRNSSVARRGNNRSKSSQQNSKSNKLWKDISGGIQQLIFLLFSKRPMQSFHLNLHWGGIGILGFINILFVGILNTVLFSKFMTTISVGLDLNKKTNGAIFGISLLSQLATLVLIAALLIGISVLLKSEKRPFKQYFQTTIVSSVPYSIVLIIATVLSFFTPIVAAIIALAGKIHAYIFLYAGFQKGHPTKKNSPFWVFAAVIALVIAVQYFFATWAIS